MEDLSQFAKYETSEVQEPVVRSIGDSVLRDGLRPGQNFERDTQRDLESVARSTGRSIEEVIEYNKSHPPRSI